MAKNVADVTEVAECGQGWWPLIEKLDTDLSALWPDYQVAQIKQKFGGLRYYISFDLDNLPPIGTEFLMRMAIDYAEEESFNICEWCGAPGKLQSTWSGWLITLCDACWDSRDRK